LKKREELQPASVSRSDARGSGGAPVSLGLVALAGLLLALLMGWEVWRDFGLLRAQHQSQVEDRVWLTAEQVGASLQLKSSAAYQLLTQQGSDALPALRGLIPALIEVQPVDPASPLVSEAPWYPALRRLQLGGADYALHMDREAGQLNWIIGDPDADRFWLLVTADRLIARLVPSHPASGYGWFLEDMGGEGVLARQHSERLTLLERQQVTAEERSAIVVSAPVSGTLWQVHGLAEPGYYGKRLAQLVLTKLLALTLFVTVMLLLVWATSRIRTSNRRLRAFNEGAYRSLEKAERRYREIFQSVGMGLCLVDLSHLRAKLDELQLFDRETLDAWLAANPDAHGRLIELVRLVDANQNTLDMLACRDLVEVETLLKQSYRPIADTSGRHELLLALIEGRAQLELEIPLHSRNGGQRHLWILMRLPERREDLETVTLSISDITARRKVELTLIEREQFWAQVVRAVPDIVFILDIQRNEAVYSNRLFASMLGFSKEEAIELKGAGRDRLIHPDDVEYVMASRNAQKTMADHQICEYRARWRHKSGHWQWLLVRSKVLSRTADGRVRQVIGVVRDVTAETEINQRLKTEEQRYRLLAENITDVIWATDASFRLDYVSPSVFRALGYTPEYLVEHGFAEIVAGPRFERFMGSLLRELGARLADPEAVVRLQRDGFHRQFSFDCIKADGHKCPIELRVSLMWSPDRRFLGLLGIARDITQQRRTENRLRMAATVFENTMGAILVTDPAGYVVQANENFTRITGYAPEDVLDQQPSMLISDRHEPNFGARLLKILREHGRWEGEVWQRRKDGRVYPTWAGIAAVQDNEGDLVSYVVFFVDVSERKANEARIESLAYYDGLTELPNRALFLDRLASALQVAERRQEWVAVLFLDLDRFKPVNDTLGHAAGDSMLREVARRLRSCMRESDTVARMGGDEFTMLLCGMANREAAMRGSINVAEKVLKVLEPAFVLQEREFFISASIGIALAPQDGDVGSLLLQNADTAMYHAKSLGKASFQFYQADMNARALERLSLENELRKALHDNAFRLHYQPQFDCAHGMLTGLEALLRWDHPEHGPISPAEFIPLAEEIGLVGALGDWVLDHACRQMDEWRSAGFEDVRMAVNLSARQFAEGRLYQQVTAVLERYGLDASCLELELTESILLQDVEETMETLAALKELGVHIAVDDFGTGYSSLNYLKDFPIDTLKIDRSFIHAMRAGSRDARLAQAIVAMGQSLQLRVIAEGVETDEQLDLLKGFGCDEVQGYLLGRPMPAGDVETHLNSRE
jgi:diguanylate cyclase (GGDEF)-like protein/PAS domain S-box-containing protein